ncbi:hypothetical protein BON22_1494 [Cyberlindnera fabianii]|uniref:Uncharacterized protein n=1 Tax=Cyberlindnera fabianii TaxID=36022 RepID=A0A1V2LAG5_CYBFA|nr:hypothetical protein BON22_1494 [Cyberlindnera fabianii]
MLYSLSSFSLSSTNTSGSISDGGSSRDSVDDELSALNVLQKPKIFDKQLEQHETHDCHKVSSPHPPVSAAEDKSKHVDSDNDYIMSTVRSLRANPLSGILSWERKNRPVEFDLSYDPFNKGPVLRVPATADFTKARKNVTWGSLMGPDQERKKASSSKKGIVSRAAAAKSILKRPYFPRLSHGYHSMSQPDLLQRPPSSLYSQTPDVTTEKQTAEVRDPPHHPYDSVSSNDKYSHFNPLTSGPDECSEEYQPPLTLTSLFSGSLTESTQMTSPPPPRHLCSQLQPKNSTDPKHSMVHDTVHSLARHFGSLSLDPEPNLLENDVEMKDTGNAFSLRVISTSKDTEAAASIRESFDGSFEDILDRRPPTFPKVSQTDYKADKFHCEPSLTGDNSGGKPFETQALFMVKERLSRLLTLLSSICDSPKDFIPATCLEIDIGEQVICLEKLQDAASEIVGDMNRKDRQLLDLKEKVFQLEGVDLQLRDKTEKLILNKEQLDRYKSLLESLENEHRLLQSRYDEIKIVNQSQTEELMNKAKQYSENSTLLRDQTATLLEAQKQLDLQVEKIFGLESDAESREQILKALREEINDLSAARAEAEELRHQVTVLTEKTREMSSLELDICLMRDKLNRLSLMEKEVHELRLLQEKREGQISDLMGTIAEQRLLLDKSNTETESMNRQQKRLAFASKGEIKKLQVLLQESKNAANDYASRLNDAVQRHNDMCRFVDDANDQNRELRLSLLKTGSQRDKLRRAFHALEVSCVQCLDGVVQEDSLEGIKQGLNSFSLLSEFNSKDLFILEDSASFLIEALGLLANEYRELLKRLESTRKMSLRKHRVSNAGSKKHSQSDTIHRA